MKHLELVLLSGEDEEPAPVEAADALQVMTIHQSKGLEFEIVFVPSLVEGRLPQSGRSPRFELPAPVLEPLVRGREDVVAEERRLLYVAMTRARRGLYLTGAAHYEGGRRWRESRFLDEVRAAGARTVVERDIVATADVLPSVSVNGHVGEVQLSYSAMTAYRDCPRQYWYRHVQRLPAVQSAEAVNGVILHEALRQAGELRREDQAVTAARLRSILDDVWSTTQFPDPRRAAAFMRNGAAELEMYRARGGFEASPAYLEQPFNVAVDGWNLRGVIDRIDRTAEGWRIIDYKSGRPITRRRRDLQVALYALGASSALKLEPLELEVVYLASRESVRIEKVDALVREAEVEGGAVAEGIKAGSFEPKPERRRCRLCPYRLACADAL
jgi:DNA helicase-2/ATP-dependent DNA helicase PcrA